MEARGRQVPKLGFGTWQLNGRDCEEAVSDALAIGYRHVDTAAIYENEQQVGRGLARSGVDRGELWLTTKVWMDDLEPRRLRASAERSLRLLGTDYIDLLLIHWPNADVPLERSLEEMVRLREEGRTLEIGVSNFPASLFRRALRAAPVFANQVEYHPLLGQDELLALCDEHDAMLTAYAPLAQGKVPGHPLFEEIGGAHDKSAAQVALRWLIEQPRVAAIPKAASHENRVANLDIFDFALSDDERARIDALPKDRREVDPRDLAPEWDPV